MKLSNKEVHENEWREKVMRNLYLKIYTIIHEKLETIFFWHLARDYPDCLEEITDVLRILCGLYTLSGRRMKRFENINAECETCHMACSKQLKHALLCCRVGD